MQTPPELMDLSAWLAADEARRRAVAESLLATLPDFELSAREAGEAIDRAPPAEWAAADLEAHHAALARPARSTGLRFVHRPTGVAFVMVPGGTSRIGLAPEVLARFDDAPTLDSATGRAAVADEELAQLWRMRRYCGPARAMTFAPFLLAERPLTGGELDRIGGLDPGHTLRIWSGPELSTSLMPEEVTEVLARTPFRLPGDAEWEHACRAGTESPFFWGDDIPDHPVEPPHPLGLAGLGHGSELLADHWFRDWEGAPLDGTPRLDGEPHLRVVRGGAGQLYPWQGGCGEWQRMLSFTRFTLDLSQDDEIDRQVLLRPAMSLPFPAPAPRTLSPLVAPQWRLAEATRSALEALDAADAETRAQGRMALQGLGGRGRWHGQTAAALPALLARLESPSTPDRAALLLLLVDLVCADHAAALTLGSDPTHPEVAGAMRLEPASGSIRAAFVAFLPRLVEMLGDPALRVAAGFALAFFPEAAGYADAVAAALEAEPETWGRASLALAFGAMQRWADRPTDAPLRALARESEVPELAGAAQVACWPANLARLDPEAPAVEAVLVFMSGAPVDPSRFPWRRGRPDLVAGVWAADVAGPAPTARLLARQARRAPEHPLVGTWLDGALSFGLGDTSLADGPPADPAQRELLALLSEVDFAGDRPARTFRDRGLPPTAEARRAWLARPPRDTSR